MRIFQQTPVLIGRYMTDLSSNWTPDQLTLLVLRLEYTRQTRSISCVQMPWLLASPNHQKPWYWEWIKTMCNISILTKDMKGMVVLAIGYCHCLRLCVCHSVCQSLACPRNNSGPIQSRITKFGPEVQNTLVKIPNILGGDWPWPSRSN